MVNNPLNKALLSLGHEALGGIPGYPDPLLFQAREQEDAQWTVEETEAWGGFLMVKACGAHGSGRSTPYVGDNTSSNG